MPVLKYLADTNAISDLFRGDAAVNKWFEEHDGQIAISTITLAEIRRGIELRPEGKIRRELEREYRFILEDFQGAIFAFDESAAVEWGKLMAQQRNQLPPYDDSLIGAIARAYDLVVATRNDKDFPGVKTVDPR